MIDTRQTDPVLTSDIGGNTVLVLVHKFVLPKRAFDSPYTPLRNTRI